jgi:hypothetical protein
MRTSSTNARAASRAALRNGLLGSAPGIAMDDRGYAAEAIQNLIEGVRSADFEADLQQGDGHELKGKFRAAHSSSALAVNTFAPFRSRLAALTLAGGGGFTNLCFERKCPHGLLGRRPPNLDVVVESPSGIVAIESKCLEHLGSHTAKFAPAYHAEITDRRRDMPWFREMLRLTAAPRSYRWLDAAQLIKHAFGLAHTFVDRPVTLLYLFWEPSNPEAHATFAEHRVEVARFAASIRGSGPDFIAMSYPELWRTWRVECSATWLRAHIDRLDRRYGVAA